MKSAKLCSLFEARCYRKKEAQITLYLLSKLLKILVTSIQNKVFNSNLKFVIMSNPSTRTASWVQEVKLPSRKSLLEISSK